jgi:hypothetical protein
MEVDSYPFHRRALTAFHQLSSDEQAEVLVILASLLETPPIQWPTPQAKRLAGDQSLYLVRVNDSLRILVQTGEGRKLEVMDLVRHETLESLAKTAAQNGR